MDQDLFDALVAAGYAATTAVSYAGPTHPRYPELRAALDNDIPITRQSRRSPDRNKRMRALVDAGYSPLTASTYASRDARYLPSKARAALGLGETQCGQQASEKKAERAKRVKALIAAGYRASTAYSMASTPIARLPRRAQTALTGAVFTQARTPEQDRLVKYVLRKLAGQPARWGGFVFEFPMVTYAGIALFGSRKYQAWKDLTESMDPDALVE